MARQSVPVDTRAVADAPTAGSSNPRAWAMKAAVHMPTLEAWHLATSLPLYSKVTQFSHSFSVTDMWADGASNTLSAYSWAFFRLTDIASTSGYHHEVKHIGCEHLGI